MHYLWLDLETTGLDPHTDAVLEVGLVVTDSDLIEHDVRRYRIAPPLGWLEWADPYVVEMHRRSGLLAELDNPFDYFQYHYLIHVERQIVNLIDPFLDEGKIVLAGSGVGPFDLQVIKYQMPELAQRLAYYVMDVGCVRRYLRDICKVELPDSGPVVHRALDDVYHHLDEARQFRAYIVGSLDHWMIQQ